MKLRPEQACSGLFFIGATKISYWKMIVETTKYSGNNV